MPRIIFRVYIVSSVQLYVSELPQEYMTEWFIRDLYVCGTALQVPDQGFSYLLASLLIQMSMLTLISLMTLNHREK